MLTDNRLDILNQLGFEILKSVDQDESVSLSPLGILLNINYLLQPCKSTELIARINHFFRLPDDTKDDNVKMISELVKDVINCDPQFVTVNLVSGVYLSPSVECVEYSNVDNMMICKGKESINNVNEAIKKRTGNAIANILTDADEPSSGLTMFGVMQFKAPFLNLFNINTTEIKDFHVSSSKTVQVPMMRYGSMLMYNDDADIGIRMMRHHFYGGKFDLVVMVPIRRFELEEMERKITGEKYLHLLNTMRPVLGSISMPKLSLDHTTDLLKMFDKIGLNLSDSTLPLDNFIHATSVKLNEFGSHMPTRDLKESEKHGQCLGGFTKPPERQHIIADEPFLIAINCTKNDSMVFLSRVTYPVFVE